MKMKRTISIELIENGSSTLLGNIAINKTIADQLQRLNCNKPKSLREILKFAVWSIKAGLDTLYWGRKRS
jgi:hypothetical protein